MAEVEKHKVEGNCWMVIGNASNGGAMVYDVSKYLDDHPGGAEVMLEVGGQDADDMFEDIGHSQEARNILKKYKIGVLHMTEEEKAAAAEKALAKVSEPWCRCARRPARATAAAAAVPRARHSPTAPPHPRQASSGGGAAMMPVLVVIVAIAVYAKTQGWF